MDAPRQVLGRDRTMSYPDDQNNQLGNEIWTVVERQLQQSTLDEVNRSLDRLVEDGHSREKAIDTIGAVLLEEIDEMLTDHEPFDRDRYVERLRSL